MKKSRMLIFQCILFSIVVAFVYFGIIESDKTSESETIGLVEESLQRTISECYSIEGEYPESLEYLVKYYNLYIDDEKYQVHYILEAPNLRPDAKVFRKDSTYEQ